jgi:hypothetical protein
MSRTEISKLMRRIMVLAVLMLGLAVASTGLVENKAGAAICCSQCYINFDNCLNGCSDQACVTGCNNTLNHCTQFCNSGC